MSKVLVLYYSSYGHIEAMAAAVAEGARAAGAQVDIKRVPELVPDEVARRSHYKLDQAAPIAEVDDLAAYDAIIVGAGTRFGRVSSQMANFLDQAGWVSVRCHDDRRRRRLAHADRKRGRRSAVPGRQDCGGREQAARLMPTNSPGPSRTA